MNYSFSLAASFPNGLASDQLETEIENNILITPAIQHITTIGDDVDIYFDAVLSGGELIELQNTIALHLPIIYTPPLLLVDPTNDILNRHFQNGDRIRLNMQNPLEVHVSPISGIGQFSTIADAIAANNVSGAIFVIHPGVYVENNPITFPPLASITSIGTAGNTIIMPADLTKDCIIIQPWTKLRGFIISGSETPGQKCLGRGVYFNGGVGVGAYALINECVIKNFDTCIETSGAPTGAHALLLHRVQVAATTTSLARGLYAHTQGQIIGNSLVISGVPFPYVPVSIPFIEGVCSVHQGTKISMNITSMTTCTKAIALDNNGEVEITLLTSTNCDKSIYVGPNNTNSKIRAINFNMNNTNIYDLDIQATDAHVDLIGAQMNESKINNPNGVKVNAQFNGQNGGKKYQALTGDLRIGTVTEPTNVAIGEGRYNVDDFILFQNSNLEIGTWTDITISAQSELDASIPMFAGTSVGNCIYIGSNQIPRGIKISVTTAVLLGDISLADVASEYWNGVGWVPLYTMVNNANTPFYYTPDPFVNTAGKFQVRFGLHSGSTLAKKTLNGMEKYWCRWRIINNWSSNPEIEYIKIHTNSTEINKDGFLEYFGDARPISKLDWSIIMTEPANASPDSQDVYLSTQLGVGRVENKFKNNANDRVGLNEFLPTDLDISFPVKIKFSIVGDTATPGAAQLTARWNTSNAGSTVYLTALGAPGTSPGEKSSSTIINISAAQQVYRGEILVYLTNVNPNPVNGQPDLIWLTIGRDATGSNANDTYVGAVTIVQMGVYYIKWRDGGHITGY